MRLRTLAHKHDTGSCLRRTYSTETELAGDSTSAHSFKGKQTGDWTGNRPLSSTRVLWTDQSGLEKGFQYKLEDLRPNPRRSTHITADTHCWVAFCLLASWFCLMVDLWVQSETLTQKIGWRVAEKNTYCWPLTHTHITCMHYKPMKERKKKKTSFPWSWYVKEEGCHPSRSFQTEQTAETLATLKWVDPLWEAH